MQHVMSEEKACRSASSSGAAAARNVWQQKETASEAVWSKTFHDDSLYICKFMGFFYSAT